MAIVLLAGAGCDSTGTTAPADSVVGTYLLREYKGLPLPFYEYDTQETLHAEKLQLLDDGTYERTWGISDAGVKLTGIYLVRGERIAFVGDDGESFWLDLSGGVLTGNQKMYFREDLELPPRHRWTVYRLIRCGGVAPNATFWCPIARVWLLENGEYRTEDTWSGATLRAGGSYTLNGEAIELVGRPADRSAGTLRNDTLTLGTFVYRRLEWEAVPRDPL